MVFRPVAEISDPIHGYVYLSAVERDIIDTYTFQRLRRIRQLAGAHLIYPGAQHSRFEHSLGTMHLAGLAGNVLKDKGYMDGDQIQTLRLAALLHDIGHGPFSHLFEEVMAERSKITHEDIGRKIIQQTVIRDILSKHGFSAKSISTLCFGESKMTFLNEVIAGGLSADIMDYLLRDSYFTGAKYGNVDAERIISSFEVDKNTLALDKAALYSFESLMISRYEMFKAVYFHKTVRSAEVMLLRSMILADEELKLTESSIENYLELTDDATMVRLTSLHAKNDDLKLAAKLARDYMNRRLLKCVFEKILHKSDSIVRRLFSKKTLESLTDQIASSANVDPNKVYIDASKAPSVPLTPAKQQLSSIVLVGKDSEGKKVHYTLSINDIPVISSISGFMDMIRVYTTSESRTKVERSVKKVLGAGVESWYQKVSM
ncbi:MAG: HD domain-containing protein [Nitrososphaerales archaeon]